MGFQLDRSAAAGRNGEVLRIEKTSIHDGQGLRTVVFLKGCPLRCWWCSTPESQKISPERGYIRQKCRSCGACIENCPQGALSLDSGGGVVVDESLCAACLECAACCPNSAVKGYGKTMSVQQVVSEICKDEVFYFHSGGGVTISGGECLLQADFVRDVLRECRMQGINTAVETSLFAPWSEIAKIIPFLNSVYVDMKHSDSRQHKKFVGVDLDLIKENLSRIDQLDIVLPVHLRIPLIPGINDSDEVLEAIIRDASAMKKVQDVEILPYHRLGVSTYPLLSLPYKLSDIPAVEREYIVERTAYLRSLDPGIAVKAGGGLQ